LAGTYPNKIPTDADTPNETIMEVNDTTVRIPVVLSITIAIIIPSKIPIIPPVMLIKVASDRN